MFQNTGNLNGYRCLALTVRRKGGRSGSVSICRKAKPHLQVARCSASTNGSTVKPSQEKTNEVQDKEKEKDVVMPTVGIAKFKDDPRMVGVYDKLIALFEEKGRDKWRRLLAISKNWLDLADGVFERITELADKEDDPAKKVERMEFLKALKNTHEELLRYDDLIVTFTRVDQLEWEALVASQRQYMTPAFFEHMSNLILAGDDEPENQEQLKTMMSVLVSMVDMHDQALKDQKALDYANDSLMDILQSGSIEEMDRRVDELAATGGLDGAMMLTVAKMYTSVKESDYTKDEVKDVMYHLYLKAKEAAAAQQPTEVRILKYILSLEDPAELKKAIDDAFTPGEIPSISHDYLYTDPKRLMTTIESVLSAYEMQRGKHTMVGQTASMMNPEVIKKLKGVEAYIKKEYY